MFTFVVNMLRLRFAYTNALFFEYFSVAISLRSHDKESHGPRKIKTKFDTAGDVSEPLTSPA
jgi:hypothetical protein